MPRYLDRHARGREEWGREPSRSQQRQAAAADGTGSAKRPPGRKDPGLCKAAHWKGPHQPVLRVKQYGWSAVRGCGWRTPWRSGDSQPYWNCAHEEACSGCGKVLRTGIEDSDCPAFHPITDAERAAVEADLAERETRIAAARTRSRWKPKPAVTGPQGYRRKKAG